MQHNLEEECTLRIGCNVQSYEAVQVVRSRNRRSTKYYMAFGAAMLALALVATVMLNAEKDRNSPPAARAVADAVASLEMGGKLARPPSRPPMAPKRLQALNEKNIFGEQISNQNGEYSHDGVPTGPGNAPNGDFTGHEPPHAVGGPLNFGPNTFYNVFDPNGSPDMGPCDPGQTGTPGTADSPRDCHECAVGHWCPGGVDGLEHDCPDKSTSLPGSSAAKQCTCQPGWFGIPEYGSGRSCEKCLAGTYCPGGRKQYACPQYSNSPDEAAYCSCIAGYFGVTHDLCQQCEANFYCPGGDPEGQQEYPCTPNSISPVGSDSGRDCTCKPGYYEPIPSATPEAGPDCEMCPATNYCPGGPSKVSCPANSYSPPGSVLPTDCVCNPGYSGNAASGCSRCPRGYVCPGGEVRTQCPSNANTASTGKTKLTDCSCNAGYFGQIIDGSSTCSLCPAGSYCPGDGAILSCTANAHSAAGSSSCECNDGYVRKADGTCYQCPANHYCLPGNGDFQPQQCPPNTQSEKGSLSPHGCKCDSGFENIAYGTQPVNSKWFTVPSGNFEQVKQRCIDGGGAIASINNILEMKMAGSLCSSCWIGLRRKSQGSPWYNDDGHPVDFTMWLVGKPDNGGEPNVMYGKSGDTYLWDDYPASSNFPGICKRINVPPSCVQMESPLSIGMRPGWLTDFYYIDHGISSFPLDWVTTRAPNSEVVADGIQYYHDSDFNKVDPNCPHDRFAVTFSGMLAIYNAGTYSFFTESDDGSHLWVDEAHVVSNGGLHGRRRHDANIALSAGYHLMNVRFFENGGGANIRVMYRGADTGGLWMHIPAVHFMRGSGNLPDPKAMGMYRGWSLKIWNYNHGLASMPNMQGTPSAVASVTEVNMGDDDFVKLGSQPDRFGAILTGVLPVYESGFYNFYTVSDDGSHLYVNGIHVVNNGGLHGPQTAQGTIRLAHGYHYLKSTFFENGGGARLEITYSGPDTENQRVQVEAFVPTGSPGTPPPPPAIGEGGMADVTLVPAKTTNGKKMEQRAQGRNMRCAKFANSADKKNKKKQLQMMVKCMSQDCEQSMEEIGCKYVTPGPGFCYTNPGQIFCQANPESPDCAENFADGGEWTPVKSFPFMGKNPPNAGINYNKFRCVCAKGCSYQKSANKLRCAMNVKKLVGVINGSPFQNINTISDGSKRRQCACTCGRNNKWEG